MDELTSSGRTSMHWPSAVSVTWGNGSKLKEITAFLVLMLSLCHVSLDCVMIHGIYSSPVVFDKSLAHHPVSFDRQHLSYDVCPEDHQNCSVLHCVLKLCTVISTRRWAVLTVLWMGFCHTGPISLYIDLFVFIYVYFVSYCIVVVLLWAW